MKALYADPVTGIIGLLIFFTLFVGILIWIFKPGASEKLKEHGQIPLKDDEHE